MGKARTSKKRASKSPFDEMPVMKLAHPERAVSYSPSRTLRDLDFVMRAVWNALLDGDQKAFKEIIKAHYEAMNITQALKRAHLSPRTFYQAVSDEGNPSLSTIAKLVHGLKAHSPIRK
jgi:DNA-binding phage protein